MSDGWLPKEDFDKLDELFGKIGFGGYYDFLQCLKDIANDMGAIYVLKGDDVQAWDLKEVKTITDMMDILRAWSSLVSSWMTEHPSWIEQVLGKKDEQ